MISALTELVDAWLFVRWILVRREQTKTCHFHPIYARLPLMRCRLFIPIFIVATILMGFFSSIAALIDRSGRTSHYFARYWSRFIFLGVGIKVKLNGIENIPRDRAVIFASNHQSTMDIPAMFGYLPVQFRIMAKQVLFWIPFLGWHLFLSGNIPVNRKSSSRAFSSALRAAALLKQGISVLVFIEGTRSRDGSLQRFKRGGFILAKKLDAAIVPIAIRGSFELMPAPAWTAKPGVIEISILPPINITAQDEPEAISARVRRQLLSAGLREGGSHQTDLVVESGV